MSEPPLAAHPRHSTRATAPRPGDAPDESAESARDRFVAADEYRVEREWRRYEGTAQRDLFRELRRRFLQRHPPFRPGPVLEVGSGPGRFSPWIGDAAHPRVLVDLSERMLIRAEESLLRAPPEGPPVATELVQADAAGLPFGAGRFSQVVGMGNVIGFGGPRGATILDELVRCAMADGGVLLLELTIGAGERSEYLHRLPPGAVRRLLRSPVRAVQTRVIREGFRPLPPVAKAHPSEFRRWPLAEVAARMQDLHLEVLERLAVAPCLGADPALVEAAHEDPGSWQHLLELEEAVGHDPSRHRRAAALLVAVRRTPPVRGHD